MVGLLVDIPEELVQLRRVEHPRGAQHRGRRALDGRERGAQLVALHVRELRARGLVGRGGSGVDVAASLSENHTIFFIMRTMNSQTVC